MTQTRIRSIKLGLCELHLGLVLIGPGYRARILKHSTLKKVTSESTVLTDYQRLDDDLTDLDIQYDS